MRDGRWLWRAPRFFPARGRPDSRMHGRLMSNSMMTGPREVGQKKGAAALLLESLRQTGSGAAERRETLLMEYCLVFV